MSRRVPLVAMIVAGVLAVTACSSTTAPGAAVVPSTAASATSSATLTEADFELPAGQDTKQLASSFTDALTRLLNGDASKAKYDEARASSLDISEFASRDVQATMDLATEGLLVPEWQEVPSLTQWVAGETHFAVAQFETALQTSDPAANAEDKEMYRWSITVDSVSETTAGDGGRVLRIAFTEHDNADKNRAGTEYASRFPTSLDGSYGAETVTFIESGGLAKISSITAG